MTKTHRKAATSADESFNRHYSRIWGEERWQKSLYPALVEPTRYACLLNQYASVEESKKLIEDERVETRALPLPAQSADLAANCFVRLSKPDVDQANGHSAAPSNDPFPPPQVSSNGRLSHWNLDAASVLVASILDVKPGEHVLDLCAAPGGKSISLAQSVWPHLHSSASSAIQVSNRSGTLHSNEADRARQRRLADNLAAYLPKELLDSNRVATLRVDGSKRNAEYELQVKAPSGSVMYDKVLVDAPCSSERHIIHAHVKAVASGRVADEMANWHPGSSKRLAQTQLDLLMTALKSVKVGGTVVYATCSIEPTENNGVLEKVLSQVAKERKKGIKWDVRLGFNAGAGDSDLESFLVANWAEKTRHGWIVLPDHHSGSKWGPLFFSHITKVNVT